MPADSVETLALRAKPVLRRYFREDSCINSTRVLLEVFRALGIAASPFSVRVMIFSPGFVQKAGAEGRMPHGEAELRQWTVDPEVYSVGVGFGSIDMPANGWPGHLVLRAGDNLVDATIKQAERPDRGIRLPEVLILSDMPETFWRGDVAIIRELDGGGMARWQATPRNNGYLGSPAWKFRPGIEEGAYREIMAELAATLTHCVRRTRRRA